MHLPSSETEKSSLTVAEWGIVEPYGGLAIEFRMSHETPFATDISPAPSPQSATTATTTSLLTQAVAQGRTLGSAPSFTPLNRPRSSSPRTTHDLPIQESDEESAEGGVARGTTTGMMLPGAYPRSPTVVRSNSAERWNERKIGTAGTTAFSARFAAPPAKEERVRGTTGLNNLGTLPDSPPTPLGLVFPAFLLALLQLVYSQLLFCAFSAIMLSWCTVLISQETHVT